MIMNTLALVAFSLLLICGGLLLTSFFGLRKGVQRFGRSHDLRFADFIQRPYWLLFLVSLVFAVPSFLFSCLLDDDGSGESLPELLIGSIFASGAIGFLVSLLWMALAGCLSLFRQLKFKH